MRQIQRVSTQVSERVDRLPTWFGETLVSGGVTMLVIFILEMYR